MNKLKYMIKRIIYATDINIKVAKGKTATGRVYVTKIYLFGICVYESISPFELRK